MTTPAGERPDDERLLLKRELLRLPLLTEEIGASPVPGGPFFQPELPVAASPREGTGVAEPAVAGDAALAERVLRDVQRQLDALVEQRVRAALEPMLERLASQLVHEAQHELASLLRELVEQAVADERLRLRRR